MLSTDKARARKSVAGTLRRQGRPDWAEGYAVRRQLPDGAHDIICFRWVVDRAVRAARRDREFWRRGPWRPVGYSVVRISRRDFNLHLRRDDCRSPDCPEPLVMEPAEGASR